MEPRSQSASSEIRVGEGRWERAPARAASNTLVCECLVAVEGADIGRDERLNAVAHTLGHLAQRDPGGQPGRGCGVAAVIDAQGRQVLVSECSLERPRPVRGGRAATTPRTEQQIVAGEPAGVEPPSEEVDQLGRDGHGPWSGLGFAGLVEGDVGLGDVKVAPAFGRQLKGLGPEHHHLGRSQAGVVRHRSHHLVGPAGRLVTCDGIDRCRHGPRVGQVADRHLSNHPRRLALGTSPRRWRPRIGVQDAELHGPADAGSRYLAEASSGSRPEGLRRLGRPSGDRRRRGPTSTAGPAVGTTPLTIVPPPCPPPGRLAPGRRRDGGEAWMAASAPWERPGPAGSKPPGGDPGARGPVRPLLGQPSSGPLVGQDLVGQRLPGEGLAGGSVKCVT